MIDYEIRIVKDLIINQQEIFKNIDLRLKILEKEVEQIKSDNFKPDNLSSEEEGE